MLNAKRAALACALAVIAPAAPHAEGRYQAVVVPEVLEAGSAKVFILDTEAGHMWTWNEIAAAMGNAGGRLLIYQGQVRPGKQMGDVVTQQEWREEPAPKPTKK